MSTPQLAERERQVSCDSASMDFTCARQGICLAEPLLGPPIAHPGQGGMLGGAEAAVISELPSTSSRWKLRGHAGSQPASAGEGAGCSRPPHSQGAAEKPEEDAGEVTLKSTACASASRSSQSWRGSISLDFAFPGSSCHRSRGRSPAPSQPRLATTCCADGNSGFRGQGDVAGSPTASKASPFF